jgi:hypothetical protein
MNVIATAGPIELKAAPVQVSLDGTLASRLDALGGRRLYLVLQDIRTNEQPGVLYHVYLNLPAGSQPGENDSHYVGSFNFYNAVVTEQGGPPANARLQSYDITEIARNLRARGRLSDRTTVTLNPSGTPVSAARPLIGRIELVVQ